MLIFLPKGIETVHVMSEKMDNVSLCTVICHLCLKDSQRKVYEDV